MLDALDELSRRKPQSIPKDSLTNHLKNLFEISKEVRSFKGKDLDCRKSKLKCLFLGGWDVLCRYFLGEQKIFRNNEEI